MKEKYQALWGAKFLILALFVGCSAPAPNIMSPSTGMIVVPGQIRGGEISSDRPQPPPHYGLYLYVLPGRSVSDEARAEIARFHCDRLTRAGPRDNRPQTALFVLPVKLRELPGTAARVDVALSADLLKTRVAAPDFSEIYIVATVTRIQQGPSVSVDAPEDKIISVGAMSPLSLSKWLLRFAGAVDQQRLTSPSTFDLKLNDFLLGLGTGARLIGLAVAETTHPPVCRVP
jgi:hypothetical protein